MFILYSFFDNISLIFNHITREIDRLSHFAVFLFFRLNIKYYFCVMKK